MEGRKNIYVGDYVRFTEEYLSKWKSENANRIQAIRQTIFLVIDTCACYAPGFKGGGMLLTLKPFIGPLVEEGTILGRSEESVALLDPAYVNREFARFIQQKHTESPDTTGNRR